MEGAIFFSSRYGSTAQYAQWIGEATDLPAFDVDEARTDPSGYDFLVLGSPVIYHKLMFHKWAKKNFASISSKPTILFSVSGAGAGPKLDDWIAGCLPAELISHMEHFALRGRQNPADLGWYDRVMLIIGGLKNPDPVASREELKGFDYMDKSSIKPIVEMIAQLQGDKIAGSEMHLASR
ncbi:MAG: hypothetical protein GY789_23745 [Hyphomicrobiales bacterium]|nr:hypothetical protein [Hyphomicrobiales bacterium]MCP4999955.1 hypothetical protein [Hyphomicrobiales bacterium]